MQDMQDFVLASSVEGADTNYITAHIVFTFIHPTLQ